MKTSWFGSPFVLILMTCFFAGGCEQFGSEEQRSYPDLDHLRAEYLKVVAGFENDLGELMKQIRRANRKPEQDGRISKEFDRAIEACRQSIERFKKVQPRSTGPELARIKELYVQVLNASLDDIRIQKEIWDVKNDLEKDVLRKKSEENKRLRLTPAMREIRKAERVYRARAQAKPVN